MFLQAGATPLSNGTIVGLCTRWWWPAEGEEGERAMACPGGGYMGKCQEPSLISEAVAWDLRYVANADPMYTTAMYEVAPARTLPWSSGGRWG
jgi:hypothetical protein